MKNPNAISETNHLLACLNEECGEVAKEVDKSFRFGLDDHNFLKPIGPSNRERIVDELNDLMGVVEMCVAAGIIPAHWQCTAKKRKKVVKVMRCMAYARKVGALK